MSRQRVAQLLTILILGGVVLFVIGRNNGWSFRTAPAATGPQDAIYAMLDAAREGDVKKYLASYTGAMETQLGQSISESSDAAFGKYLKEANAALKGVAVMEPESVSDSETKVRVEYVYQDRNESQLLLLRKIGRDWKIASVDSAQRVKTLVPYGTPVR